MLTKSTSKFVSGVTDSCDEVLRVAELPAMVLELVEVEHLHLTGSVADDIDVEVHRDDSLVSDAETAGDIDVERADCGRNPARL